MRTSVCTGVTADRSFPAGPHTECVDAACVAPDLRSSGLWDTVPGEIVTVSRIPPSRARATQGRSDAADLPPHQAARPHAGRGLGDPRDQAATRLRAHA